MQRGGQAIELSAKEFSLLEYFMRHPGEVLTRTQILEHVWDFAYDGASNVVDVYVRYLRDKIDRPFDLDTIETVRGAGYRLPQVGRRELTAQASAATGRGDGGVRKRPSTGSSQKDSARAMASAEGSTCSSPSYTT